MIPLIKGTHEQQLRDALEGLAPDAPISQVDEIIRRIDEIVYSAIDLSIPADKQDLDYDPLVCTLIDGYFRILRDSAL